MRLICPNCDAQYEVPDDVIPEGGRDVQCSNCGQTWLAGAPPEAVEEPAPAPEPVAPPEPEPEPDVVSFVEPEPEHEIASFVAPEPEPEPEPDPFDAPEPEPAYTEEIDADLIAEDEVVDFEEDVSLPPPPDPAPQRRELDPEVARILQEEAERETHARAEAARQAAEETFASQGDLDLDSAADPAEQVFDADRPDEDAPDVPEPRDEDAPEAPVYYGDGEMQRSELLPDVEEINDSLRPDEVEETEDEVVVAERRSRSGFRLGFGLVLLIAAVLTLAYTFNDDIGEAVPGMAPALADYKAAVDEGRLWLDLKAQEYLAGDDAPAE